MEIGNEPVAISNDDYRTIFTHLARGLRAGDPAMTIVTGTITAGTPDKWSKDIACLAGLDELYDVINLHRYPAVEGWPTWQRSHPEDPVNGFLTSLRENIAWRDRHAPDKAIWLTEFGYDACTDAAMRERHKPFTRWVDVTDRQQALWIVRAFLVVSALPIERAYLYFYNDDDAARVHAAAGITRNFNPKPSFHAMAHLYATLGPYRFARIISTQADDLYHYEYVHGEDSGRRMQVVWRPRRDDATRTWHPDTLTGRVIRITQTPLQAGAAPDHLLTDGAVTIGPAPLFIELQR